MDPKKLKDKCSDSDDDFDTDSRNLSSLFSGQTGGSHRFNNDSFAYQAPKAPAVPGATTLSSSVQREKDVANAKQATASYKMPNRKLLFATVAECFQYDAGEFRSCGKLGVALLSLDKPDEYQLLLYQTKSDPLCCVKITRSFLFKVLNGTYLQFAMEHILWSIQLDSTNLLELTKWIVAVRALLRADSVSDDDLDFEDIIQGEGSTVETDSSLELECIQYRIDRSSGLTFNRFCDEHLIRLKVGKAKHNKTFERSLIGMRKGGARLVVIYPNSQSGVDHVLHIPADVPVLAWIFVKRLKIKQTSVTTLDTRKDSTKDVDVPLPETELLASSSGSLRDVLASAPLPCAEDSHDVIAADATLVAAAITAKQEVLSRVARLGQSVFRPTAVPRARLSGHDNASLSAVKTETQEDTSSANAKEIPCNHDGLCQPCRVGSLPPLNHHHHSCSGGPHLVAPSSESCSDEKRCPLKHATVYYPVFTALPGFWSQTSDGFPVASSRAAGSSFELGNRNELQEQRSTEPSQMIDELHNLGNALEESWKKDFRLLSEQVLDGVSRMSDLVKLENSSALQSGVDAQRALAEQIIAQVNERTCASVEVTSRETEQKVEVRGIMKVLHKRLSKSFESDKEYSGSHVKDVILRAIKEITVEAFDESTLSADVLTSTGNEESERALASSVNEKLH